MILDKQIYEIENLLKKGKVIQFNILQISFNIACIKIKLDDESQFIVKFDVKSERLFKPIESEAKNLQYLNKKLDLFPEVINFNENCLITEFYKNDNKKPTSTNLDFLDAIIKIHSISNNLFGFEFNTQIGALEQHNKFEKSWTNFYSNKRLNPIFELANTKKNMGNFINEKINYILKNIKNFIPDSPVPQLLHGDLWDGNIIFNNKNFVGFIDPGSFYGHNEMEIAYLRWFDPPYVDSNFLQKYNEHINIDKSYLNYEPIYQLYYALCNVALWDESFVKEVRKALIRLKL